MKHPGKTVFVILNAALTVILAGAYPPVTGLRLPVWIFIVGLLLSNILPFFVRWLPGFRLRLCGHGELCLKTFALSQPFAVAVRLLGLKTLPGGWRQALIGALVCVLVEALIFWNGMISVYCSSVQLGIRLRTAGMICGMIPVVHLFMLGVIIRTVSAEVETELEKYRLNEARRDKKICATKYPILLVHGVFFRDSRYLSYWGRIPAELEKNGAEIFYGNQPSAASVDDCGAELAARIKEVAGGGKVNIIAHSKGGLDAICAAGRHGAAEYTASITTVNTPHRGCEFADYLLNKIPDGVLKKIAGTYNAALSGLGEKNSDFEAAVRDLTASARAEASPALEGIFCQSVGSRLDRAVGGRFPLNFTYNLVKYFDGPNDGLVSEKSFPWGERYTCLAAAGKRGISHGDMIDLNRENIPGFDVREFYVRLVADLKDRGL